MKPFESHIGTVLALHWDHLDNNDLIPSFLASHTLKKGSGNYFLNNSRYLPGLPKRPDPDFPLNQEKYQDASILVPGHYFATEIEDEQAVWSVIDAGFKVVVSNEIGHNFKVHSYRNGLLAVELPIEEVDYLSSLPSNEEIVVNLADQKIETKKETFFFEIDPDEKEFIMYGLDDVGETLEFENSLEAYEKKWDDFYTSSKE